MKTLNTFLTISILALSNPLFAYADDSKPLKNMAVPVAPSVWANPEIGTPEILKFIKAKNAHVPVANFIWGSPTEIPSIVEMIPVAPFIIGESTDSAPIELTGLKPNSFEVPVAPFILGEPVDAPSNLHFK